MSDRIDFRTIADAARASFESLLLEWLPGGRREGHEFKALNPTRADSKVGSFSVNLNTGAWGDFATGDKGGDAISLFAYLQGLSQLEAAKQLARDLGVDLNAGAAPSRDAAKKRTEWTPILPVPVDAPEPPKAHVKRGRPEATWRYRTPGLDSQEARLLGLVYRFSTSDGGKEILPCCYAEHAETKAREWRWMAFPQPRPLYIPRDRWSLDVEDRGSVLIVEGEKCADVAAGVFPTNDICTWPGGSKAVDKVDWSLLAGRDVLIWPDCDAQTDKEGAMLPEVQQPGVKAAERIAELLRELQPPAKVKIVAIPKPGQKAPGWDIADAVADGWTNDKILDYVREHQREPAVIKSSPTQRVAYASSDGDDEWRRALIWSGRNLKDCRENIIYLLRDHPEWKAVLGADEFAKRIVTRRPSPLRHVAGAEWSQDDDVALALWLAEREGLLVRSPDTVRAAVQFIAKRNGFHPVREYLETRVWDNQARVDSWVVRFLGAADTLYNRLVGRFFLINMVRRVYEPGCIMRSVPVLEGSQDKGKSTALRLLAQPWFSDTTFKIGDKDAFQQIQGVMVYEISELESFTRAEVAAVKAFISSTEDNFRAPYERQNEKHKRQTVFAASTNACEYLKDWTGNTRFWPLACGPIIDLEGIARDRDQLLAEALFLYRQGERTYPTAEQQATLFKPEQDRRMMAHPWQEIIAHAFERDVIWNTRRTVTVNEVMGDLLKIDLSRINPQGSESQRVGQILHALEWVKRRASEGSRSWVWARPSVESANEKPSDIPF